MRGNGHRGNRSKMGIALALALVLLLGMTGCAGSKGYSSIDTKGQKILWISCDWSEDTDGQVLIRRYVYDKSTKSYVSAEEQEVPEGEDRNDLSVVVEHQGVYEIELSAEGYETQTRMVEVDDATVYRVMVHMPALEVPVEDPIPSETTLPAETTFPVETTLPVETTVPTDTGAE